MKHLAASRLRELISHTSVIEDTCVHSEYETYVDRHMMDHWRSAVQHLLELLFGADAEHPRRFRASCVDNSVGNLEAGKLIALGALEEFEGGC